MKSSTLFKVFAVLLFSAILSFPNGAFGQKKSSKNSGYCPTYNYKGQLVGPSGDTTRVTLSMMRLLDGTLVCSYYHDTLSSVTYALGGTMNKKSAFQLYESRGDSLAFVWEGKRSSDLRHLEGKRINKRTNEEQYFLATLATGQSYWDYIRQKEGYPSYTDLNDALRHKEQVKRLDFERQGFTRLPDEIAQLNKVEAFNLLGNQLDTFPTVLTQMKDLFYLSLCSNKMKYIGPEIGELTNMRVLIINMNGLHSLPKEIGNLTNLMYLDVGENPIDSLPEEIGNLQNLQVLHIDNWGPSSARFTDEYKQHLQELLPNCRIHFDKNDW